MWILMISDVKTHLIIVEKAKSIHQGQVAR